MARDAGARVADGSGIQMRPQCIRPLAAEGVPDLYGEMNRASLRSFLSLMRKTTIFMGLALSLCLLGTYLLSYYLAFVHDAQFSGIGGKIGSCRTGDNMSYTGPFLPTDRASIRIHADFRTKTITKTITCRGLWVIYWPLVVIDINLFRPYRCRFA